MASKCFAPTGPMPWNAGNSRRNIVRSVELFPLCADENIAVIPYNPLAGGLLTGTHRRGEPTEGTRFTSGHAGPRYQERYRHETMFDTVDRFQQIAEDAGVPMTTLAIQWVLANPVVTAPIIGASSPDQLSASPAAIDAPLDPQIASRLDTLTHEYRFGDHDR